MENIPIYLIGPVIVMITFFNLSSIGLEESKALFRQDETESTSTYEHRIKVKGVLDRFDDNDMAVILIEEFNEEVFVPEDILPAVSRLSMWFDLELAGEEVEAIAVDWRTTWLEMEEVKRLMAKLRE